MNTNDPRYQTRLSPINLHLIRGGAPIILNAWSFGSVTPFGNVGSMLTWAGFDDPIYVYEDAITVLNAVSKGTGLDFSEILDQVRGDRGYQAAQTQAPFARSA